MQKTGLYLRLQNLSVSARIAEREVGIGTAGITAASRFARSGQVVKINLALTRWQCRHRK
jgi:hypothetical protein